MTESTAGATGWEREQALFAAAMALPPGERTGFLAVACHGDASLRRRVGALLAAEAATGGLPREPAGSNPAGLVPGTRLGPFEVGEVLGQGGMGVVYAALDVRLQRPVALKTLHAWAGADPELKRRLEREAELTARLQHPYACQVLDVLEHAGVPVLVLERLTGEPLAALLAREGRLPLRRGVRLLRETAEAVAAAHELGIVHRDLKPSNLFVLATGHVKVLDFGIARPQGSKAHGGTALTGPGVALGTPGYCSPEQASGEEVDARSDIFSLGIVAHELLSGTNPFQSGSAIAALARLMGGPPPGLREAVPDAPEALDTLLGRMLAPEPSARPGSMADVARELQRIEDVLATPAPSMPPDRKGIPTVSYAQSGKVSIAWQAVGDGPVDVVYVPGWITHLESSWEDPHVTAFYRGVARFSRLLLFDKRGTGMSDRSIGYPTLEDRMDDVRAVMDAARSERAVVFGMSEGGNLSITWAAAHPERVLGLALFGVFAARVWSPEYPWAPTPEEREAWIASLEAGWGGPLDIETLAPSLAEDPGFRTWWARYLRSGASPGAAVDLARFNTQIDVRQVLRALRVPTLVMHRRDDRDVRIDEARWIAGQVPGAELVELEGADHLLYAGDVDTVVDTLERFVARLDAGETPDQVLLTLAALRGARSAEAIFEEQARHFRGEPLGWRGDDWLVAFDGPARAVRMALTTEAVARGRGGAVAAAVHTGAVTRGPGGTSGPALDAVRALAATAAPGEVIASDAVQDLVAGAGLRLERRGTAPGWRAVLGG